MSQNHPDHRFAVQEVFCIRYNTNYDQVNRGHKVPYINCIGVANEIQFHEILMTCGRSQSQSEDFQSHSQLLNSRYLITSRQITRIRTWSSAPYRHEDPFVHINVTAPAQYDIIYWSQNSWSLWGYSEVGWCSWVVHVQCVDVRTIHKNTLLFILDLVQKQILSKVTYEIVQVA